MRALIHVSGFSNTQRNVVAFCLQNACLSRLSLSLKLSHHQFITSVGVAEVENAGLPPDCVVILGRINTKRNYLEPTNPSFLVPTRFIVQVSCAIFDVPTTKQPKDHKDY